MREDIMAETTTTLEDIVFIKQLILAEDINWGVGTENQIRNGISVTGNQINSDYILYNNPSSVWHKKTVTEILTALIAQTGITPA